VVIDSWEVLIVVNKATSVYCVYFTDTSWGSGRPCRHALSSERTV